MLSSTIANCVNVNRTNNHSPLKPSNASRKMNSLESGECSVERELNAAYDAVAVHPRPSVLIQSYGPPSCLLACLPAQLPPIWPPRTCGNHINGKSLTRSDLATVRRSEGRVEGSRPVDSLRDAILISKQPPNLLL